MAVEWKPRHVDGAWWALVDNRVAGEVVRYGGPGTWWWAGVARRERIPGRFDTDDEAKAAVERALDPRHT